VTLTAAAPGGGFQVALSSNNASLSVPTSVTVAAGSTSANFQIVASTVALRQTVTLTASLSNSSVSTSVTVKPQVATLTGLLNPASNQLGQACSPDAIATLLGSGFTSQPLQTAPASSWPMRLAGVQVNINDQPAALLAVSDSFIHFQCPALAPRTNLRIVVQPESAPPPDALATVMQEATPSVFELDTTHQGAVMIAGTDLVASAATDEGPSRPAKQGEYISIYADGLGSLSENLPPGQPAPLDPLIWAMAPIKVVIGDSNVVLSPSFAGLTPGGISLFVVNVQLTSAVPTGSSIPIYLNVTLSDGTVISTNTVRIAIANADVQ
jgi:uncharacterized protein (TIGR03437 family)